MAEPSCCSGCFVLTVGHRLSQRSAIVERRNKDPGRGQSGSEDEVSHGRVELVPFHFIRVMSTREIMDERSTEPTTANQSIENDL